MKFLPLLLSAFRRKRMRTLLTAGSILVALFLFGLLSAIDRAFTQGIELAGADRLIVRNKTSIIISLPYSYKNDIMKIPGVKNISYACWFGGVYKDPKNFFPQYAIDKDNFRKVFPEYIVPKEQEETFLRDKEGCIVGRKIAERFGWKIGDRIPILGTIYPGTWEFNICGIYDGKRAEDDLTQLWFRYDYLEERRTFEKGMVGWYSVTLEDPDRAAEAASAIDSQFANSPYETASETEKGFMIGFMKQVGNIKLILLTVGGVVFFTLLLVTGTTMAVSVRERTVELGILKSIGFSDLAILSIIISESVFLSITGGAAGILLAKLFTISGPTIGGFVGILYLTPARLVVGFFVAMIVGVLSGMIPAIIALRLRIVDALRRV